LSWRQLPLLRLDRPALQDVLEAEVGHRMTAENCERQLNAMSDQGWNVSARVSDDLLGWAVEAGLLPLEVQARRAIGLRDGDVTQLETAVQVAEACGADALLARARYEAARSRRDAARMDAALEMLEAMGDRGQIARYRG
jgi:hypothetical protein